MFERFSDVCRRAVVLAHEEARTLDHDYVGSGHLLLGLAYGHDGVAVTVLDSFNLTLDVARRELVALYGRGQGSRSGPLPYAARVRRAFELSVVEALHAAHRSIETEHLLLGLSHDETDSAGMVLGRAGATLREVRRRVNNVLTTGSPLPSTPAVSEPAVSGSDPEPSPQHLPPAPRIAKVPGRVFVCYRREDSEGYTGRICDVLLRELGEEQVFVDVDSIGVGRDFVDSSLTAIASCETVIAVVGPGWLDARLADGRRRLDQSGDYVRVELESALIQGKRIIPVLVQAAVMPRQDELPTSLHAFARRNAVPLRHRGFHDDIRGLLRLLNPSH